MSFKHDYIAICSEYVVLQIKRSCDRNKGCLLQNKMCFNGEKNKNELNYEFISWELHIFKRRFHYDCLFDYKNIFEV